MKSQVRSSLNENDFPLRDELPEGWKLVTILDVCEVNPPKPPKDFLPADAPVTFVPMPAVDADQGAITNPEIRPYLEVRNGFTSFRDGDVIMAKITPCMENGKAAIIQGMKNGIGFGSTEFHVLRSKGLILPQYLYYFIRQVSFRKEAEDHFTGSVGQKRVPIDFIKTAVIPLPPLSEQHRIVARVEALLSQVNAAHYRLNRVPLIMKRFRQAVLAAACSGRLTEGWREGHPDVENAGQLLNKIKPEVRQKRRETKIITSDFLNFDLLDLPISWSWATTSDICIEISDGDHYPPPKTTTGIPFIVISNISDGKINFVKTMHVSRKYYEELPSNRKPKYGDSLYSVTGSFGIPVLVDTEREFCFQRHIALLRPHPMIPSEFLWILMKSDIIYNQSKFIATGIAQLTVPLAGLRLLKIPIPPLEEQNEIVRRVNELFALADQIEQQVAEATKRTEVLTQAVLAKAFRGELVVTEDELSRKELA
jgi:type I restriction enzyme S subunit